MAGLNLGFKGRIPSFAGSSRNGECSHSARLDWKYLGSLTVNCSGVICSAGTEYSLISIMTDADLE